MALSDQIDSNIAELERAFEDCGDYVGRKMFIGKNFKRSIYVAYIDMLVDTDLIVRLLAKISLGDFNGREDLFEEFCGDVVTPDMKETENFKDVADAVLSGDTIIFVENSIKAVIISSKGWPSRGVSATETEVVVEGSKDAFTESFRMNTMLVRRRIKDTNLKVKQMIIGRRSQTSVGLMYLQDVATPNIVSEIETRLNNIDIDAIIDSGYISQLIKDDWLSPFPQTLITERPDKAASAIFDGRVVIAVDNSPFVIIAPSTLPMFFQASDDYYQDWQIASLTRLVRYIAGAMAISLPGLYIALSVFHPSMIPMQLVFKMAATRLNVPFPAFIEILIMEAAFEILREAGLRLPGPVGGAVGIVGGLIVGQAAVEAGIVCPMVVIIVALTGIASFSIPNYSLASGYRIIKYIIIIFSAMFGFFGFWMAMILVMIHMASLKTIGLPYLYPFVSGDANGYSDWKDTIFRLPLFMMRKRPFITSPGQKSRMSPQKTGKVRKME